jgi:hypothetical protein
MPFWRLRYWCGIGAAVARIVLIQVEGTFNSLEVFGALSGDSDVTDKMAKRMASRTVNAGRVILGTMQITRVQALVFWVKKDHVKIHLRMRMQMNATQLWLARKKNTTLRR